MDLSRFTALYKYSSYLVLCYRILSYLIISVWNREVQCEHVVVVTQISDTFSGTDK